MDRTLRVRLFRSMLRVRRIEEAIADRYADQQMRCPVHLSIGQEAVAAGVCTALRPTDGIFSGHRAHGHYLAAGGDLKAFIAEMYGKATGCCRGMGGSMHLVDLDVGFIGSTPIVGGTIPLGVGAAFGEKLKGTDRVIVVFLGEGATEEGVFAESLNYASLQKLPVVFVCENNFFSVYTPVAQRQSPDRDRCALAAAHGIPTAQGDGNDPEEVHRMAAEAVARARRGEGPTFLEFATYRWREHCGPNYDNDLGYRTEAEFQDWKARDPVACTARRLEAEGALPPSEVEAYEAEIAAEITEAFAHAQHSPFPHRDAIFAHVHA